MKKNTHTDVVYCVTSSRPRHKNFTRIIYCFQNEIRPKFGGRYVNTKLYEKDDKSTIYLNILTKNTELFSNFYC